MFIGKETIKNALNYIKELEEDKRITELTKISCCTAQNCGALENAIREGLENDKLKKALADSTPNSVIREKIEELENSQKRVKNNNLIYSREDVFRFQIYVLEEILKEGEK